MRKLLYLILALVMLVGCLLVGCDCSSSCSCGQQEQKQGYVYPEKLTGEFKLFDYENYTNNFEILQMSEMFGKLSVNHEKSFVKSGNQSLKITPLGSRLNSVKPYFVIPTVSERFNFNYSDFNNIYSVKFSVYSDNEIDVNMSVGLTQSKDKKTLSSFFETYALKTGWNEIEYKIWDGAELSSVTGIYLRFDNFAVYGKQAPSLYLDDFILNYKAGIVRNTAYYPIEQGELLIIKDFSNLVNASIAGYTYSPEWVSDADLALMKGEYQGKALKFNLPLGRACLKITPRLNKDLIKDCYAEGYTKISFWVAAEASNGKIVKVLNDDSIYASGNMELESGKWTKISVELSENNIDKLFERVLNENKVEQEGQAIRLCGFYLSTTDRLNDDGSTATMTVYLGDVKIEK